MTTRRWFEDGEKVRLVRAGSLQVPESLEIEAGTMIDAEVGSAFVVRVTFLLDGRDPEESTYWLEPKGAETLVAGLIECLRELRRRGSR